MNTKISAGWICIFCLFFVSLAQGEEPLLDYVEKLLNEQSEFTARIAEAEAQDDSDMVQAEKSMFHDLFGNLETGEPSGGYLFRFQLNVIGNEPKEIFFGISRGRIEEHSDSPSWLVYFPQLQKFASESFRLSSEFWLKHASDGSAVLSQYAAYKGDEFLLQNIIKLDSEILFASEKISPNDSDLGQQYSLGVKQEITIEKILLHELLANPSAAWRPVKTDLSLREQYKDSADQSAIASAAGFTFQQANTLLQQWKNQ